MARTYYLTRDNSDGSKSQAWAAGGWLAFRSGLIGDVFGVHIAGYTSQPIFAPPDEPTEGPLKGFRLKTQYANVWPQGNVRETQPEFRFIVDYTVLFRPPPSAANPSFVQNKNL